MPKLSELNPKDIQVLPPEKPKLKLSQLKPEEVLVAPAVEVGESALRGAAQGASFGFADELTGAGYALKDKLLEGKDFTDSYKKHRDESRANYELAQATNPNAYLAGEVGGGVASLAVPGMGIFNAGKAATMGGQVARGALSGAGAGALSGAGTSEADIDTADFAKDVGTSAAIGAGAGGVLSGLGKYASSKADDIKAYLKAKFGGASDSVKDYAEKRAVKAATGQNKRALKEIAKKDINKTGRVLLDEGIVTPGSTVETIGERAADARKSYGKEIGDIRNSLDELAPQGSVSGKEIADAMRSYAQSEVDGPASQNLAKNLMAEADNFETRGNLSFKDAQRFKKQYGFDAKDPAKRSGISTRDIDNKTYQLIEDQVEKSVGNLEATSPDLAGKLGRYKDVKDKYGAIAPAAKAAEDRAIANLSNNVLSPSDKAAGFTYLLSKVGEAALNPLDLVKAIAVGGTNKAVRGRFDSTAAVLGDKLANTLASAPERLGRYANILTDAAQKGPQAAAAIHFVLMQRDPEYRNKIEELENAP